MADQITNTLYLSIGTVNFATPAFDVQNIETLLDGPDVRGSDRIIPGTAGVRPYKRRATVSTRLLHLQIYGNKDRTGAATSGPLQGLIDNVSLLREISDPVSTGAGTQTATLHLPAGGTLTASVHVGSNLQLTAVSHSLIRGILTLEIIGGSFT